MVLAYTAEEIYSYEKNACLPEGVDLKPFIQLVETVTEVLRQLDEQYPRRRSFNLNRPHNVVRKPKEVIDDDGFITYVIEKTPEEEAAEAEAKNANSESAVAEDDDFTPATKRKGKQHITFKTNAAKISSGKSSAGDARDSIAITQVSKFNAFDALLDDEE
ncbi:hypothetical protein CANINC_001803 [Pichia inconspicua]|uniref:Cap-associated protein CAF20 n=1 Tax=Pichia inconspicua TaxID=52247 RepID=A0A4T0X3C4_9ASCO|nr:hypothetical protein CANINC_001803 [[Candida] inconspicua]